MSGRKRSLSQSGGPCRLSGDPEQAQLLATTLAVDTAAKPPLTHSFHAYPARMHPETAHRILKAFPEGPVLDPFLGGGTTALEAVRAGRPFAGSDISRVALEIAWARTRVMIPAKCREIEAAGHVLADRAWQDDEHGEFRWPPWALAEREWYDAHTLREICLLKALIDLEEPSLRRFHTCVLCSIVVKFSRQISESDPRMDANHRPRARHGIFRAFQDRASELTKGLLLLSSDLYKRKVAFVEPELTVGDARTFKPSIAPALVLTSPPYAGTYTYSVHHARQAPLLGEPPPTGPAEIGARRSQGRGYREDMQAVLKNLLETLAPGGRIAIQVGDGLVEGQPLKADQLFAELAGKLGGKVVAGASQRRRDWSGGPPREEHLLLITRA